MRFRGHGASIDAHDVVLRANAPELVGYEDDVGRKLTIRVVWGNAHAGGFGDVMRHDLLQRDETTLFNQVHLGDESHVDDTAAMRRLKRILVLDNRWMVALGRATLNCTACVPSTGFQALAVALVMTRLVGAPSPSVYGFGACVPCI